MTRLLPMLLLAAPTIPAAATTPCYGTATYVASRQTLADLPTARDRQALGYLPLIAAFDDLEDALVLFIATEGQSCRYAEPARQTVDDATNALAAASAGPDNFECTCADAVPISGFDCDSCDYHDTWGCQCWFIKTETHG